LLVWLGLCSAAMILRFWSFIIWNQNARPGGGEREQRHIGVSRRQCAERKRSMESGIGVSSRSLATVTRDICAKLMVNTRQPANPIDKAMSVAPQPRKKKVLKSEPVYLQRTFVIYANKLILFYECRGEGE
jgi:hypothetical protein